MELEVPSPARRTESDGSLSRTDTASDNEEPDKPGVLVVFVTISTVSKSFLILSFENVLFYISTNEALPRGGGGGPASLV